MSSIPRLSDIRESNIINRPSRIAMPTRGSSSKRGSSHENTNRLLSATKSKRSLSATPLRTPSTRAGFNPLFTAEKGEDKKVLQHQTTKILDYLNKNMSMNFQLGNLRSITTKQFIQIITHFIKIICGNRFSIRANTYVDDLSKILVMLEYPHNINKSWFKTPNAPHAYTHVLTLFNFFIDLVIPTDVEEFERDYIVKEDFPTVDYALMFLKKANEGFSHWNQNDDIKFNELKQNLVDQNIQIQTKFRNFELIDKEFQMLRKECDDIAKNPIIKNNEQEYEELNNLVNKNQQVLKEKMEVAEENERNLQHLQKIKIETDQDKLVLQESVEELKNINENQILTSKERDELIEEISNMKKFLVAKISSVKDLQDTSLDEQIRLGRIKQKSFEAVNAINNFVHKLEKASDGNYNFDIKSLTIPSNHNQNNINHLAEYIEKIEVVLTGITVQQDIDISIKELKKNEIRLNLLLVKKKNLDEKMSELTECYEEIQRTGSELDLKLINLKQNEEDRVALEKKIEQLKIRDGILSLELKKAKDLEATKLAEKEELLRTTAEHGNKLLSEKKEYVDNLRSNLAELKSCVQELDTFFEEKKFK